MQYMPSRSRNIIEISNDIVSRTVPGKNTKITESTYTNGNQGVYTNGVDTNKERNINVPTKDEDSKNGSIQ
ncbi:hypothetical protein McpAg1_09790 [Methanocorpusculaceae archaeon Ag1]|uniref:Uncharacterized protein n=1 Tax=Methanorbis furvi TaxID=3028299 RepID=A0AAE4SAA5_9EURY|nr:hypothetical protein [Methanocorpusculaceae archaeon Ag1]